MKTDSLCVLLVGHLTTLSRQETDTCSKEEITQKEVSIAYIKLLPKHSSGENKKAPWSESASELYRPRDRSLSAKLVPTFTDRGTSRS
jgi:hypothetical protein